MRSPLAAVTPPPLPTDTMEATITVAEWYALPVAARVAHRLSEVLVLLDIVRDELRIDESGALVWMEEGLERACEDTGAVLERLSF